MASHASSVRPFALSPTLRNPATLTLGSDTSSITSKSSNERRVRTRTKIKQKLQSDLAELNKELPSAVSAVGDKVASSSSKRESADYKSRLVVDESGIEHDPAYLAEQNERNGIFSKAAMSGRRIPGSPLLETSSISSDSSDASETEQDDTMKLHSSQQRHSFNAMRMPGLQPGVSTLPSNVSISGHVISSSSTGSTKLDAYTRPTVPQLRLTSGSYRSPKPSTLNHSKRNSAYHPSLNQAPSTSSLRDTSPLADTASIAPTFRSSMSQTATSSVYNPYSYTPGTAVKNHRYTAYQSPAPSMFAPRQTNATKQHLGTRHLSTPPTLPASLKSREMMASGSSAGSEHAPSESSATSSQPVQWEDSIDLASFARKSQAQAKTKDSDSVAYSDRPDPSTDRLNLSYIPSLEHPERHRSSAHRAMPMPDNMSDNWSKMERNWEKTKLDARLTMFRSGKVLKKVFGQ